MNGPTWADVATRRKTVEFRDVSLTRLQFLCPFCRWVGAARLLTRSTGHRCSCGALFYTHQAVAVHFKERE